ncbi:hypothetical protein ACTXT7_003090 [Hymenolepis weldensis]
MNKLKSFKKGIEDVRQGNETALEASKKELTSIPELPELATLTFLKSLTLSFNKIQEIPDDILALRDNDLIYLPPEIGKLTRLKEFHIQGNRLTVLPPELGNLDLTGPKQVAKLSGNYWVSPIEDQLQVGLSHVFDYIRSETYKFLHDRHLAMDPQVPPKADRSKKISRKR